MEADLEQRQPGGYRTAERDDRHPRRSRAAFLAPWLIVMNPMLSGSLETRTIDVLTAIVRDIDATASGHEEAAIQADQQSKHVRQSRR